jgi:hypothetical protein
MFLPAANDSFNELQQGTNASPQLWIQTKQAIVAWGQQHPNSNSAFPFPPVDRFRGHRLVAYSDANGDIQRIEYGDV